MEEGILPDILTYVDQMPFIELAGLIFGLLCVFFLIRKNILTWPMGIAYVLVSFYVFWESRLYGDFILHVVYLVLNIYGWVYWVRSTESDDLIVYRMRWKHFLYSLLLSMVGIWVFAYFLRSLPDIFPGLAPSELPYWDSTTSVLSITAMWLTARKYIENWWYWFIVDIVACGVYAVKGIYFYSFLYGVYIVLAILGYLAWRQSLMKE